MGQSLVDKIADIREDSLAQFYAQQSRTKRGAEVLFKTLKDGVGQVRLPAKQAQQRRAVGWPLIVSGQSTCRADG